MASGWHDLINPAQVIGGFATALGVVVAVGALIAAGLQVLFSQRVSREAGALQAYREYLRLCFENPEFSSYNLFNQSFPGGVAMIVRGEESADSEKYLWLVSILLTSCEEILLNVSSKGEWRSTLVSQLGYHGGTLEIIWPDQAKHYDQRLSGLVEDAIAEARGGR